jgi:hypothetical protein
MIVVYYFSGCTMRPRKGGVQVLQEKGLVSSNLSAQAGLANG